MARDATVTAHLKACSVAFLPGIGWRWRKGRWWAGLTPFRASRLPTKMRQRQVTRPVMGLTRRSARPFTGSSRLVPARRRELTRRTALPRAYGAVSILFFQPAEPHVLHQMMAVAAALEPLYLRCAGFEGDFDSSWEHGELALTQCFSTHPSQAEVHRL